MATVLNCPLLGMNSTNETLLFVCFLIMCDFFVFVLLVFVQFLKNSFYKRDCHN